jgi:hypothetical protein
MKKEKLWIGFFKEPTDAELLEAVQELKKECKKVYQFNDLDGLPNLYNKRCGLHERNKTFIKSY